MLKVSAKEQYLHQSGRQLGFVQGIETSAKLLTDAGARYRKQIADSKMSKKQRREAESWVTVFDKLATELRKLGVKPAEEGQRLLDAALAQPANGAKKPGKISKVVGAVTRALSEE
jgi:hypothetical protein